jgi:phosphoglycolate phosphatase
MPSLTAQPKAILFDLDGTLVDTAPDLVGTLFDLLVEIGEAAPGFEQCRVHVSQGVRGLLGCSLGIRPGDDGYEPLRQRFLELYANRLARQSELFPGVVELLDLIAAADIPWALATNKPERFTTPLIAQLGLVPASGIVLTPDHVVAGKPDPAMIHLAVNQLGMVAGDCWFVGDALQDITAGNLAGVVTAVAGWGYIPADEPISEWQADIHFSDIAGLLALARGWAA